ncbi:MAG: PilZ domain-containing protein [Burkholderiales bacterium]
MNRPERRKEQRLALSRRAQLISDAGIRQCLLQDISSGGFLILTNERYASGEVLELACELYPEQIISCKIQVRHVDDTCIGTLIVDISPQAASLLSRFLAEHNSQKLKDRPQSAGDDLDFTKDS